MLDRYCIYFHLGAQFHVPSRYLRLRSLAPCMTMYDDSLNEPLEDGYHGPTYRNDSLELNFAGQLFLGVL